MVDSIEVGSLAYTNGSMLFITKCVCSPHWFETSLHNSLSWTLGCVAGKTDDKKYMGAWIDIATSPCSELWSWKKSRDSERCQCDWWSNHLHTFVFTLTYQRQFTLKASKGRPSQLHFGFIRVNSRAFICFYSDTAHSLFQTILWCWNVIQRKILMEGWIIGQQVKYRQEAIYTCGQNFDSCLYFVSQMQVYWQVFIPVAPLPY
jgi:hypothetical protein